MSGNEGAWMEQLETVLWGECANDERNKGEQERLIRRLSAQ